MSYYVVKGLSSLVPSQMIVSMMRVIPTSTCFLHSLTTLTTVLSFTNNNQSIKCCNLKKHHYHYVKLFEKRNFYLGRPTQRLKKQRRRSLYCLFSASSSTSEDNDNLPKKSTIENQPSIDTNINDNYRDPIVNSSNNIDSNNENNKLDDFHDSTDINELRKHCSVKLHDMLPPLATDMKRIYLIRHGETDWNALGKIQGGGYDLQLNLAGTIQAKKVANVMAAYDTLLFFNEQQKRHDDTYRMDTTTFDNSCGSSGIQLVISSHLSRAQETANCIVDALQKQQIRGSLPIHQMVTQNFGEMRFGDFEGLKVDWNGGTRDEDNDSSSATTSSSNEVDRYFLYEQAMTIDLMVSWPGGESPNDVYTRGLTGIQNIVQKYPKLQHICIVAHGRFNKIMLTNFLRQQQQQDGQQQTGLLFQKTEKLYQGNACINVFDICVRNNDNKCTTSQQQPQEQHTIQEQYKIRECKVHVINFVDHMQE